MDFDGKLLFFFNRFFFSYKNLYLLKWLNPEWYVILDDCDGELPTRSSDEFRPFIRRLPEFKFWYSVSKSTLIALLCTMFECFNIPVFWPILVMYFITLFCITMKRQIKVRSRTSSKIFFKSISRKFTPYLKVANGNVKNKTKKF